MTGSTWRRVRPAYRLFVETARSLARRNVARHSSSQSLTERVASRTGAPTASRSRAASALPFASAWVRP